jgi:hypothetical protein
MLYYESDHCLVKREAMYFDDISNQSILFPPFMIACTRSQHCTVLNVWKRNSEQIFSTFCVSDDNDEAIF